MLDGWPSSYNDSFVILYSLIKQSSYEVSIWNSLVIKLLDDEFVLVTSRVASKLRLAFFMSCMYLPWVVLLVDVVRIPPYES